MMRLVAAVFVLQLLSSMAAIFFLRTEMLEVVRSDRVRQVTDLRDDLLTAYYDGGRDELANFINAKRGSAADPTVFIALSGHGPTILNNLSRVPSISVSAQPHIVHIHRGPSLPETEGMAIASSLPGGDTLVVGVLGAVERRFTLAFAAAIGLTVVIAVALATVSALLLGFVISQRTHEIADTAAELASGNFGARLSTRDTGDGFDHLRLQMNLMAERIDELVSQLSAISGALAHDLRSPVTRLSAAIDTALARVDEPGAADALQAARADADALRSMLENALEISRLEGGAIQDRRVPLDLAAVAEDLVELYEPLAEQSGVTLCADARSVTVPADREFLSRALANLIDNALKYGGSTITVATRAAEGWGEIIVSDDGPGIPEQDRARVVERFVRLDNARTRTGGGLGLAMVAAVARLHGGELVLSGERGLVATLRLPR
ncbi:MULTISPECIES: ATP-binding protein [unclassified Novosphingobium]|jgi:signal transduction histidine kinase|uniref:HAMP domain-containing sensor histidine kinase n=1 Tax=unclassified Novosphingobium TaxID=2644732 RepID=UPI00061C91EF|nr:MULTISPECIES: ATP-binding protein [unclassified Novosphingobium]MBF5090127.1 sensor histidine kinase [Novosphingobium sp. NBM11]RQW45195.1 sensor histidine kinase [Novosphingobium sp. LASN5T]GAO54092.1 two component sensor histidine kinase [Novosphingobium sp. MD-1]